MNEKFVIIIVNSIEPYCYELNNILSLQDNFSYRFRYQKKREGNWMPEVDNPAELKNCKGLIVLRDFQHTAELIPIRKIFIYEVIAIGDIVYIEYLLKEKTELSSNSVERDKQLSLFNQRITTDINTSKYPNNPKEDLKNLIFFGTDYTYDILDLDYKGNEQDKDSNRWGNLIETIGLYKSAGIEVYKDSDFLKIIGVQDENGVNTAIVSDKNKTYYRLDNGKVYKIVFLQRTFTGRSNSGNSAVLTPRTVILKAGNPELQPIISQKDIMGKYDLIDLTFKTNISSPNLKSYLILDIVEEGPRKSPSLIIPIKVVFSVKQFVFNILSVLTFVFLFLMYMYAVEVITMLHPSEVKNEVINQQVASFKNVLLPLMIVFGSHTFRRISNIKEFIFGRLNL